MTPVVIDIHTHYFPENLAEKAIQSLSQTGGIQPYGNGTYSSLLKNMAWDGVSVSFNQPVATRPEQVSSINRQMADINRQNKKIQNFGSMHPGFKNCGDVEEEVQFLKKSGIKGIKMHPEYQSFYPDDPLMTEIYEACSRHQIAILFHAGRDIGFETLHATPSRLRQAASFSGIKMVMAHMGGYQLWDEVLDAFSGADNIYLDTAYAMEMNSRQMIEVIRGMGTDHIIFGSDFPWQKPGDIITKIKALDLGEGELEKIFCHNVCDLLGL